MKHSPSKMPLHSPLWLESVEAHERTAARVAARRQWRLLCVLAVILAGGFLGWLSWVVPAVKRLLNDLP